MMTIIGNREYVQKKGIGGPCFKLYIQIHVLLPLSISQMTTNWNSVFASPLAPHLKLLLPLFIFFSLLPQTMSPNTTLLCCVICVICVAVNSSNSSCAHFLQQDVVQVPSYLQFGGEHTLGQVLSSSPSFTLYVVVLL